MLFANLELAVNAAILNHLANVQVMIGGVLVPGIFRSPAVEASVGIGAASTAPVVSVASNAVMLNPVSQVIEIDAKRYAILDANPDNTGLTVLDLEIVE